MSETWRTPNFDESAGEQSSGQPADSANSSGGYANPYPGQGSYPGAGYDDAAGGLLFGRWSVFGQLAAVVGS